MKKVDWFELSQRVALWLMVVAAILWIVADVYKEAA